MRAEIGNEMLPKTCGYIYVRAASPPPDMAHSPAMAAGQDFVLRKNDPSLWRA